MAYQLGGTDVSWSSVFRQLESNKERLGIIDYSVSQTTLEQVRLVVVVGQDFNYFVTIHENTKYFSFTPSKVKIRCWWLLLLVVINYVYMICRTTTLLKMGS